MSERLLTDERILGIWMANLGKANVAGDPDWRKARRAIAKEQDAKTLKAVGECIDDFVQMHFYARPDKPNATMKFKDWMKLKGIIEAFKRGEMPEEK